MGFLPDRSKVVLRHLLEQNAEEIPGKECVLFEDGERWTYGEALKEAYRAANALSKLGVKRGENVLIFLPNSQGWLRAWWGVGSLGAIVVPVNTAYKGEMLRHICQDSEARHIITSPDLAKRVKELGLDLNIIDPTILATGSMDEPKLDEPIEPWDTYAIMYTSGTTGPSKGVITPYLLFYMNGFRCKDITTPNDTMLLDLPLFHIYGASQSYALWAIGGRIALRTKFSASNYLDVVRECGATMSGMLGTIPQFLAQMRAMPNDSDNPLRAVNCAPMVNDPKGFVARFGIEELWTGFGTTEATCIFLSQGPIENPKSCGKVRSGLEVRLVDDHDIPVPIEEIGELIVRSNLPWELNAGYWRRPEETAKAWRNGWFHTGDLFYCDEEGNYFYVDRKKDALRRRGENISSFEVEREVMAYPDVHEAACVAVPGEFGGDEVKVFVVPREGSKFDPVDLITFLIPRIPYFMVPRFIEVVSTLPKTPTMRVKKYELREQGNCASTWDREAAGIVIKRNS